MGRRSKYTEEFPVLVEQYAKEGMIERDIAKKLGVSVATFEEYKNRYPELLEALKDGKRVIDFQVETSLLRAAMGFEYTETKRVIESDGSVRTEETRKQALPNVTAQIFWLKNRQPDEWRDATRHEFVSINNALREAEKNRLVSARERDRLLPESDYSDITPLDDRMPE